MKLVITVLVAVLFFVVIEANNYPPNIKVVHKEVPVYHKVAVPTPVPSVPRYTPKRNGGFPHRPGSIPGNLVKVPKYIPVPVHKVVKVPKPFHYPVKVPVYKQIIVKKKVEVPVPYYIKKPAYGGQTGEGYGGGNDKGTPYGGGAGGGWDGGNDKGTPYGGGGDGGQGGGWDAGNDKGTPYGGGGQGGGWDAGNDKGTPYGGGGQGGGWDGGYGGGDQQGWASTYGRVQQQNAGVWQQGVGGGAYQDGGYGGSEKGETGEGGDWNQGYEDGGSEGGYGAESQPVGGWDANYGASNNGGSVAWPSNYGGAAAAAGNYGNVGASNYGNTGANNYGNTGANNYGNTGAVNYGGATGGNSGVANYGTSGANNYGNSGANNYGGSSNAGVSWPDTASSDNKNTGNRGIGWASTLRLPTAIVFSSALSALQRRSLNESFTRTSRDPHIKKSVTEFLSHHKPPPPHLPCGLLKGKHIATACRWFRQVNRKPGFKVNQDPRVDPGHSPSCATDLDPAETDKHRPWSGRTREDRTRKKRNPSATFLGIHFDGRRRYEIKKQQEMWSGREQEKTILLWNCFDDVFDGVGLSGFIGI
ncbi:hypothetical protein HNY73_021788 [Argiope bruennichi]|uniref:Uncharacterized protein n=1 Tax=Argiope bruennichi TaxID=94029 RepID=A0A8T0E2D1_ARGBR|nr:hypothetical protein HNY73_021788 [Argiope bruennichi]